MLFTRCPDCDTTFRITADALGKADGQVRCGRCACVFNAYSELREQRFDAAETEQAHAPGSATPEPATPATPATPAPTTPAEAAEMTSTRSVASAAEPSSHSEGSAFERAGTTAGEQVRMQSMAPVVPLPRSDLGAQDVSFGDFTVASIIEQIESSAVDDGPDEKSPAAKTSASVDSEPVSEHLVDSVLEGLSPNEAPPSWPIIADEPKTTRFAARRWLLGAVGAAALLALQMTHHFRAELAGVALVGPLLQETYALFGAEVVPHWHLEQYEIVDWVATAEPDASGQGSLKITARIQNKGPQAQPYPHVQVQLNDRWEEQIGQRIFEPSEYLSPARRGSLMAPGATARAELEVVDPGPEAYGFELDVCVQGEAKTLRCSADAVFPSM